MEPDIEEHITRFLGMLDTAFRRRGEAEGLPERFAGLCRRRRAIASCIGSAPTGTGRSRISTPSRSVISPSSTATGC